MPGAKFFSILDSKSGFWQIPLDEASSKVTIFGTLFGRYRFLCVHYTMTAMPKPFHLYNRVRQEGCRKLGVMINWWSYRAPLLNLIAMW